MPLPDAIDLTPSPLRERIRRVGLWLGPLLAVAALFSLPDSYVPPGAADAVEFTAAGQRTTALAVWMAVWWMTEAIPVYATALLPLPLLPLLGAGTVRDAAAPYGTDVIFLFLGGFLMALSMQRWGLDRRIAFRVLRITGSRAERIVLGFMTVTAMLSMWVSNTAATLALYPVAISVLALAQTDDAGVSGPGFSNLSHALLLGVAYAASIGGVGTMISTPPNLFLVSFVRDTFGVEIGFFRWMLFSIPVVLLFLPTVWWLLTRLFPVRGLRIDGMRGLVDDALRTMGPSSRGERITMLVFGAAVFAWLFRPLLMRIPLGGGFPLAGLTDPGIAVLAALTLFVLSADRDADGRRRPVMNWETAQKLPFGLLLLFGGGLSLAAAIERYGVGGFLGAQLGTLQGLPMWVFIAVAVVGVMFVGELISNTAAAATFIPICAAAAQGLGWDPLTLLIPIVWAANCSFMLPVATPPNAIVYGSGWIDAGRMAQTGFVLNLAGIALFLTLAFLFAGRVFPGV